VVLACGGFSHNAALGRELFGHDPRGDAHFSPTTAANSGDNVRLGTSVGGAFTTEVAQPAAWAPVSVFRGPRGRRRVFPHLRGVGLPGIIAVNRHGRRFTNESDSYHDFGPALVAANSGDDDVYGFLIADARTMHKYGIGYAKPWPVPRLRYRLNGYLLVGRSLEQLASRAGIDPVGLRATVEDFNRHARRGEDPVFDRGLDEFNHFKGDPEHKPNPSLAPVEKGPFYATKIRMGDLGTFAGLAADAHGRVLDEAGHPVPGLYAVGSAASSVFGGAYPGHGANLGPAMTFGYLVGRKLGNAAPITDAATSTSRSSA
jgi:succinate dehydrogenase/fumarate reductase flavoprotein subunit